MFPQDVVARVLNNQLISLVWIDERLHNVFFGLAYVVYCHQVIKLS
ncbi:hypothetical protein HanHA300_Chr06g0214141 [Helianthus annuus]|nr:hypothetical protein HanHA300_Chr06g0214141 [Helianthus annuus]